MRFLPRRAARPGREGSESSRAAAHETFSPGDPMQYRCRGGDPLSQPEEQPCLLRLIFNGMRNRRAACLFRHGESTRRRPAWRWGPSPAVSVWSASPPSPVCTEGRGTFSYRPLADSAPTPSAPLRVRAPVAAESRSVLLFALIVLFVLLTRTARRRWTWVSKANFSVLICKELKWIGPGHSESRGLGFAVRACLWVGRPMQAVIGHAGLQ